MRKRYTRMGVELANQGAHEMGFTNIGAMWRSKREYMRSEAFGGRS